MRKHASFRDMARKVRKKCPTTFASESGLFNYLPANLPQSVSINADSSLARSSPDMLSVKITEIASPPSNLTFEPRFSSYQQSQPNHRRSKASIPPSNLLRHCVSAVSNQSTVVHRPNLASRPTVLPSDNIKDTEHTKLPFGFNVQARVSSNAISICYGSNTSTSMMATSTASTFFYSPGDGTSESLQTHRGISSFAPNGGMSVSSRVVISN